MISKNAKFYLIHIIISVIITLPFLSCNIITEPEPFDNKNIRQPEIKNKTAVFNNFYQDQTVTGVITLSFIPDIEITRIDSIILFIDSIKVGQFNLLFVETGPAYIINVDTRNWTNGKHFFYLKTYKIPSFNDSLGIKGLLINSLYIYRTSLIFDNTPPTAPENILVRLYNEDAQISWESTDLNNFNAYVIRRNGNKIAEIFSQTTSAYIDTTISDFFSGYYEVGVSNGSETKYSEKYNFIKGELLGLSIIGAIDDLDDQVVFIQSNNSLTAVSTQTKTVITQSTNGHNGIWAKSANNDTLYCWDFEENFYTYNTTTLNLIRTQRINLLNNLTTFSQIQSLTSGPVNNIYMAITVHELDKGKVTHGLYAFEKDEIVFNFSKNLPLINLSGYVNYLSASPDGDGLLMLENGGINKYLVNNDSIIFNLRSTITDFVGQPQVDWKNAKIFTMRYKIADEAIVENRDINTLNLVMTYELPEPKSYPIYIGAFFANSKNLYVAYYPNFLVKYDLYTGELIHSWKFSSEIQSLYGSEKGRYLFACTSTDQWIVDIGGTP